MPWEKQFNESEVVEKAMRAFWENGYNATSLGDLVERTGVGRGSLYSTFKDKHDLFLAALRMYDDRMRRRKLEELESSHSPREAVRQLLLAFTAGVSKRGGNHGCFLTNTALELSARDPDAAAIVAASQEEIEKFFLRSIRRGQAEREIPASVDAADAARGLLATLIGLIVLTRSRPDRRLLESIVADAMRRLE
jgi:TetR/AcrR family transcriptional repressor of nem operon